MVTWPASLGYRVTAVTLWVLFLAAIYALALARVWGLPSWAIPALTAVPAATVVLQFVLAYRLIAAQDEFSRAVTAKRVLVAAGLTIAATVGVSVAEQFAGAPQVPMWLDYPLFWSIFVLVTPVIRDSRL